MKIIHTFLSILLILCLIYTGTHPNSMGEIQQYLTEPFALLLICFITNNIVLGVYYIAQYRLKHVLQILGSLSIAVSSIFLILQSMNIIQYSLPPYIFALCTGIALHFLVSLCTLRLQFPRSRRSEKYETGIVKWFSKSKGFGFITRDQGDDLFVHYRAISGRGHRTLVEGQAVQFCITKKNRGLQASDVTILNNR